MPEVWKVGEPAAVAAFSRLTAMKPRQVMLSASSKPTTGVKKPALSLTTEQRKLLLRAICQFLELNDFSKTLKKLLSEADIEKDSWKSSSLNLEDMCCHYLAMRDGDDQNIKGREEDGGINSIASGRKGKTEKKRKNNLHNQETDVTSYKHSEDNECDKEKLSNVDGDGNVKLKEKKKKKSSNDSSAQMVEKNPSEDVSQEGKPSKKLKNEKKKSMSLSESVNKDSEPKQAEPLEEAKEDIKSYSEVEKAKSKSGKKKKLSSLAEAIDVQGENKTESGHVDQEKQQEGSGGAENGVGKEKKSSKKRKRNSSEDDQDNNAEDFNHTNTGLTSEQRASASEKKDSLADSQTPSTVGNDSEVLSQNERDKSATQKSSKRQNSEPRAQNAFQRVKADEVVFVDERLQDNSYWAKDGAEVGYGAKAQEVLGQVRGRDFRHEKTKKKRGSYRGGQIDLQSHSIKFNYSDED